MFQVTTSGPNYLVKCTMWLTEVNWVTCWSWLSDSLKWTKTLLTYGSGSLQKPYRINQFHQKSFQRQASIVCRKRTYNHVIYQYWLWDVYIFVFFIKILRLKNVDWFYFLPEIKRGTHSNISKKSPLYFRCWGVVITFPTKSCLF